MNSPKKKDNKSKAKCNETPKMIQIQTKPKLDFLKNCRKMQSIISQVTTSKCPNNYWWCPTALPLAFFSAPLFFCPLQSGTLPMTTPHRHQRWCVVSLHNQGTAVLIPNVGRGGGGRRSILYSLLFALFLSVVDPSTAHFGCDDRLSLVVDDSGINSAAAHLFMICKT